MVLPWLAAAWLAGIAVAPAVPLAEWQWGALAVLAALAAWATRREPRIGWSFLAVVCLCLGALRLRVADRSTSGAAIASHIPSAQPVDLHGLVLTNPTRWGDSFAFDLETDGVSSVDGALPTDGTVRVVSATRFQTAREERVIARGRLRRATRLDGVDVAAVLEAADVRSVAPPPRLHPLVLLDAVRGRIIDRLDRVLPGAEASLVAGVLLGADEGMPEEVQEAFRATGTAHILAVSGFNVTIVAAAAMAFCATVLGARRGAAAAAAAVVLYTLLCGAEPAVVRASIMACVALLALRLGRQPAALASLAAAALLMSVIHPRVLFDVGFQLSFLATLGLVLAGRPTQEAIRRWSERAVPERARSAFTVLAEVTALSLIAQAATLPLSAFVFLRLPLTSLPANALILPIQPLLMAAGAATAIASLVSVSIGRVVAWLAWPPAAYTIRVAEGFASLPGASLTLAPFPSSYLLPAYAALGGLLLVATRPSAREGAVNILRKGRPLWLLGLAAVTIMAWKAAAEAPDGRLHVTAFPGGDLLITSPTGRFVAVTPGRAPVGLRQTLDGQLPLSHPALDWVILTDSESSPKTTFEALGRHRPRGFILGGAAASVGEGSPAAGIELVHPVPGTTLDLGAHARLEIVDLGPRRTTVRLTYGSAVILISEDETVPARTSVAARPSAVFLVGEGRQVSKMVASEWSSPRPLVIVAAPLPGDPFPMDLTRDDALPVAATPLQGWIRLSTDGTRLWLQAERVP